jgi:hypothetical protein
MMGELYRFEERKTRRFQRASGLRNMVRHMPGRAILRYAQVLAVPLAGAASRDPARVA